LIKKGEKMNNKRRGKFFVTLKYAVISISLLMLLLLAFKKDLLILITHLSHKNEIRFIKTFLKDFKTKDIENLREYFLDEKINMRALKFMNIYDKHLKTRNYFLDEFVSCYRDDKKTRKLLKIKDKCCIKLSTLENGKKLDWIEIFIIKKNSKYYIEHFQISEYFPRPPNEVF
jgi:hypothetical protein